MSETAAVAAPESAPVSSADLASDVVSASEAPERSSPEAGDSGDRSQVAASSPVEDTSPRMEPKKPSEASKAAEFLRQMGHDLKRSDGRRAFMPVDTVAKMLDRYLEEGSGTWTSERTAMESRVREMEQFTRQLQAGISGDPRAFLSEVAAMDPRYQAFLEDRAAASAPAPASAMPAPDLPLPDGSRTYSVEGLQSLIEWAVEAKMMPKVDERLKPWTEREAQAQQQAQHQQVLEAVTARSRDQLTEAQAWPLFGPLAADGSLTEFQTQVLGELQRDSEQARAEGRRPSLSLEGAYIRIASQRWTEDDSVKRKRILSELQGAPRSTAAGPSPTDAPARRGPRSSADIVRDVMAKLDT